MNAFDFVGFNRSDIETLLGMNLHDNLDEYSWALKNNLPKWMVPYLSRVNISLETSACFIAGENPTSNLKGEAQTIFVAYKDSLWDAVDSGELAAKDIIYYENYEGGRRDCTLLRSEVESWVRKHDFHWPLPIENKRDLEAVESSDSRYLDQWGEFPGKNTALMMIAGMSVSLEKVGSQYRNGSRLNKLAIARAVSQNLTKVGFKGPVVTEKQMTNLIKEALEMYLPDSDNE